MSLTICQATSDDLPTIVSILNQGILSKLRRGDTAWGDQSYDIASLKPFIDDGSTFIALNGTNIVGTFRLVWQDNVLWGSQPPEAGYVQSFSVASGNKGQNIGGQIIDLALAEAALQGRAYLRLACPSNNGGLRTYYEKQGFHRADSKAKPQHPTYSAVYYERSTGHYDPNELQEKKNARKRPQFGKFRLFRSSED